MSRLFQRSPIFAQRMLCRNQNRRIDGRTVGMTGVFHVLTGINNMPEQEMLHD